MFFFNLEFLHKIDDSYNQILRTLNVMHLLDLIVLLTVSDKHASLSGKKFCNSGQKAKSLRQTLVS